ncbi:MAG: recombinase family protein [Planctomyces sp.]|nr:recombinase family protein [Planctomyces sp.]
MPERAATVKRIFNLYASGGHTFKTLRDLLYEEGHTFRQSHPTVRWKGGRHLARFKHHGSSPDSGFDLFQPADERHNSGHQKEKAVRLFRRTASFEDKSGRVRFV